MTNLREVAAFLLGEGELDGVGFGDPHPTERGNYWWRKHLRAALAQPEQEPVAQVRIAEDYHAHVFWMVSPLKLDQRYLYAAPRSWKGLTDEQIKQIEMSASSTLSAIYLAEAQLKGKNT